VTDIWVCLIKACYSHGLHCCLDDHSRVVLHDTGDDSSDYINANYIDVRLSCTLNSVVHA